MSRLARTISATACLLATASLVGCDSDGPSGPITGCRAMAEPAVSVTPVDADTKAPIEGVQVTAREGPYVDTATTFYAGESFIPAHLGPERPGTYEVTAEKEGFTTWTISGVVAEARECGPATVEITVSLSPRSD